MKNRKIILEIFLTHAAINNANISVFTFIFLYMIKITGNMRTQYTTSDSFQGRQTDKNKPKEILIRVVCI